MNKALYLKGFKRGLGYAKALAQDAAKWITVHPNGKGIGANGENKKGSPVLLDEETGEVLGGMGGKFTGRHISAVPQKGALEQVGAQMVVNAKNHKEQMLNNQKINFKQIEEQSKQKEQEAEAQLKKQEQEQQEQQKKAEEQAQQAQEEAEAKTETPAPETQETLQNNTNETPETPQTKEALINELTQIANGTGEFKLKTAEEVKKDNLEDFGEVLWGARKHFYQRSVSTDDLMNKPLKTLWKLKDVTDIKDPEKRALVMSLRASIPPRPKKKVISYNGMVRNQRQIDEWVQNAQSKIAIASSIVSDDKKYQLYKKLMAYDDREFKSPDSHKRYFYKNLDSSLYDKIRDFRPFSNTESWEVKFGGYISSKGLQDALGGKLVYTDSASTPEALAHKENLRGIRLETKDGTLNVIYNGQEDAKSAIDKALDYAQNTDPHEQEAEKKAKELHFTLYRNINTGKYFYAYKNDKHKTALMSFDDIQEARGYLDGHKKELTEAWEAASASRKWTERQFRNSSDYQRTGSDYRKGKDVTPDQFQNDFKARGVQFGNWVSHSGALSRQSLLNQSYDALHDLSSLTGISPQNLFLDGSLGLALGARGVAGSGALAHYELNNKVINLTKYGGAGCIAHEWFHALDNFLGSENKQRMASTDGRLASKEHALEVYGTKEKADVAWAFQNLINDIKKSDYYQKSKDADKYRSTLYWSKPEELAARGFEGYIKNRMKSKGVDNTFLVNYDNSSGLWLSDKDVKALTPRYDELIRAIRKYKGKGWGFED